jgi:hypothetical protein
MSWISLKITKFNQYKKNTLNVKHFKFSPNIYLSGQAYIYITKDLKFRQKDVFLLIDLTFYIKIANL